MSYIEVEKDGVIYAAEYICSDNEVVVLGNGKTETIFLNGMKEINAAKTALRTLIRQGKAFTKAEIE
ncbi:MULTISPECIES: hypothetical protein [unclassified Brenneria]|uniref:hypothetical protein n=1 Tax=unclassified Brenneria TaxID=2634434 RepID=UPI0015526E97|nr:hypothetical protein [Brenneria sp. hezel4-2-4]MEE3649473.1 hypothetical protein [Brenneria sp. HEZEL_4_2_4]NPC99430.1 hypothetical protein [Brenneria sp. hezel4-2-4]